MFARLWHLLKRIDAAKAVRWRLDALRTPGGAFGIAGFCEIAVLTPKHAAAGWFVLASSAELPDIYKDPWGCGVV